MLSLLTLELSQRRQEVVQDFQTTIRQTKHLHHATKLRVIKNFNLTLCGDSQKRFRGQCLQAALEWLRIVNITLNPGA